MQLGFTAVWGRACGMLRMLRTRSKIHRKSFAKGSKVFFGHWQKNPSLHSGREAKKWKTSFRIWAWCIRTMLPAFIHGRERKTCNIYTYMSLELLGYSGSLTSRHSLAFCAFGSWVVYGEPEKCLVAMEEENFILTALPCQALFSSSGPPLDICRVALYYH